MKSEDKEKDLLKEFFNEKGEILTPDEILEVHSNHCEARMEQGEKDYGVAAYRDRDCIEEVYEEVIDCSNWYFYHIHNLLEVVLKLKSLTIKIEEKARNEYN